MAINSNNQEPYIYSKKSNDPKSGYYVMKLTTDYPSTEDLVLHLRGVRAENFYIYNGYGKLLETYTATEITKNYTSLLSELYLKPQSNTIYILASHNVGNKQIGVMEIPEMGTNADILAYTMENSRVRHAVAFFLLLLTAILMPMIYILANNPAKKTIYAVAIFTGLFGLWVMTDFPRHSFWIRNAFSSVHVAVLLLIFILSKNYMTCAFVNLNRYFLEKRISRKIADYVFVLTFLTGTLETILELIKFVSWNSHLFVVKEYVYFATNWIIIIGSILLLVLALYESYKGSVRAVILSIGLAVCLTTFFVSQATPILISHWGVIVLVTAISIILTNSFNEAHQKTKRYMGELRTKNDEMALLNLELDYAQTEMLLRLGSTVDVRSHETSLHVQRVSEYTRLIATTLGLTKSETEIIAKAATLHDIGKVGIPDGILNTPGKLSEAEYDEMKKHARMGFEMLNGSIVQMLDVAAIIALTHHERYDGNGYPEGLRGDDIPIQGLIVSAADVFDALLSERVYKKAWSLDEVMAYFEAERGKHFHPDVALAILENKEALEAIISTLPYENEVV
jgi:HD-GYP domain-containing protein (c-di-GMP phosphodiesterase class II)